MTKPASKAIEHLRNEHRNFEQILRGLEAFVNQVDAGGHYDRSDLAAIVDFVCDLSALRHEEKEESLLLPALVRLGFDWNHGALPHVRREHREERYLLRSLRHSARQTADWSVDDRLHFVAIAREFVAFTRRHMASEEAELFPAAEAKLPAELDDSLLRDFEALDEELDAVPDTVPLREKAFRVARQYVDAASAAAET